MVECSCRAYEELQNAAGGSVVSEADQRVFLSRQFTCMHARLVFEEFSTFFGESDQDPPSNLGAKITRAAQDESVVLVDEVFPYATTKFSVAGDPFSFVHLWFEKNNCFAQCQDGRCLARRRKVPKNNPTGNHLLPM